MLCDIILDCLLPTPSLLISLPFFALMFWCFLVFALVLIFLLSWPYKKKAFQYGIQNVCHTPAYIFLSHLCHMIQSPSLLWVVCFYAVCSFCCVCLCAKFYQSDNWTFQSILLSSVLLDVTIFSRIEIYLSWWQNMTRIFLLYLENVIHCTMVFTKMNTSLLLPPTSSSPLCESVYLPLHRIYCRLWQGSLPPCPQWLAEMSTRQTALRQWPKPFLPQRISEPCHHGVCPGGRASPHWGNNCCF